MNTSLCEQHLIVNWATVNREQLNLTSNKGGQGWKKRLGKYLCLYVHLFMFMVHFVTKHILANTGLLSTL